MGTESHQTAPEFDIEPAFAATVSAFMTARVVAIFTGNSPMDNFLEQLGFQAFGSGLGVFLAYQLNARMNRKWQAELDQDRCAVLLRRLQRVFEINIEVLHRALEEMQRDVTWLPTFIPSLAALDAAEAALQDLALAPEITVAVDKAHFELGHVTRRLELLLQCQLWHVPGDQINITDSMRSSYDNHPETAPFGKLLRSTRFIPRRDKMILDAKIDTISLAVGLSDPDEKPREGAAVKYCRTAIKAIETALDAGNAIRNSRPGRLSF